MTRTTRSASIAIANAFCRKRGTVTASVPGASNQGIEARKTKAAFPRSSRLRRHADFERVYQQGRRHFSASLTVFYLERPPESADKAYVVPGLRVGFTVGRALGGAVQRNRMKRRLREAVRITRPASAPCADVVINPKKALLTAGFDSILNELRQAFVVIERKLAQRASDAGHREDSESRTPKAERR